MTDRIEVEAFALRALADDMPVNVRDMAKALLLDLIGVGAAGSGTELSHIIHQFVVHHMSGSDVAHAPIVFDGRIVSPSGAALALASTIDSMDAHDGYRMAKGHAGCASLAVVLATARPNLSGAEFFTRLVIGYEVGCRAGVALHDSARDYHTLGAWMALACAAISARALEMDEAMLTEASGIAEYHGPRSPMMRCIDHPTMVKDGSGWGAMAGVSAAYLAQAGFTGAPADTLRGTVWNDIGAHWLILEQYIKPEPVCRWAQPAVHAAQHLQHHRAFRSDDIAAIRVRSFDQAVRLAVRHPKTTEQAQYSLPFPLAVALVRGRVGPNDVMGEALTNPVIRRLSAMIKMEVDENYAVAFPDRRIAEVTITLRDGTRLASGPTEARGDPETPLSANEIRQKYHRFADDALGVDRANAIEAVIDNLWDRPAKDLVDLLTAPVLRGSD